MTISTYSAFNYGHTITENNQNINFNEGLGELQAQISIGSYTLGQFVDAVSNALNAAGDLEYSVSLSRNNNENKITISASSNFDLLISSGTQAEISAFELMGFTGADLTSNNTYQGNNASGTQFEPQNILQSYIDFEDNFKTVSASVNESASGQVEVVSYGKVKFMQCNILPQTNILNQLSIKDDANGKENLRDFLNYATTKAPMEFIPDIQNPNSNIRNILLESSKESRSGTDATVKQYKKLFKYFESGRLIFRELT